MSIWNVLLCRVDVYQRYHAIVKRIKHHISLIDVGGGPGEILSFLSPAKNRITILDISKKALDGVKDKRVRKVLSDGSKIPFKNNKFDYAVSIASLEHVPRKFRMKYCNELKRVCREKVLLYVPCGEIGSKYDKKLLKFSNMIGFNDSWTKEHLKHGIPSVYELKQYFPGAKITKLQNAKIWLAIMMINRTPLLSFFQGAIYFTFLQWFDNRGKCIACVVDWDKK